MPRLMPKRNGAANPDYRDTFANERTFLAWIRTALAFLAGGFAVAGLLPRVSPGWAGQAVGIALVLLGMTIALASILRWARNEEAMTEQAPLAQSRLPLFTALGVVAVAVAAVVLLVAGGSR
jgi:putative membrane protein